jgi:hypothetical protein
LLYQSMRESLSTFPAHTNSATASAQETSVDLRALVSPRHTLSGPTSGPLSKFLFLCAQASISALRAYSDGMP